MVPFQVLNKNLEFLLAPTSEGVQASCIPHDLFQSKSENLLCIVLAEFVVWPCSLFYFSTWATF